MQLVGKHDIGQYDYKFSYRFQENQVTSTFYLENKV